MPAEYIIIGAAMLTTHALLVMRLKVLSNSLFRFEYMFRSISMSMFCEHRFSEIKNVNRIGKICFMVTIFSSLSVFIGVVFVYYEM